MRSLVKGSRTAFFIDSNTVPSVTVPPTYTPYVPPADNQSNYNGGPIVLVRGKLTGFLLEQDVIPQNNQYDQTQYDNEEYA